MNPSSSGQESTFAGMTLHPRHRIVRRTLPAGIAWAAVFAAAMFMSTAQMRADEAPLPLRVHADGRHLETADGRPFVWIGDTAWELFHRLDREEAALYLDTRRRDRHRSDPRRGGAAGVPRSGPARPRRTGRPACARDRPASATAP